MYNPEKKEKTLKKEKKVYLKKSLSLKKKVSLKYLTTVTTWTVIRAYGERGEETIQFTHFRSF